MIPRRKFLVGLPATALAARYAFAKSSGPAQVLFGTAKGGTSKGIYIADWNEATGEIGPLSLAAKADNPTFLVKYPHPKGHLIFCVCEKDKGTGAVCSFLLETGSRTLKPISAQDTLGNGPTHLSIHPSGTGIFVANYGGGSITSFHVRPDGSISPAVSHFQYKGHGPNPDRQEKPHAHSAQISPDGRFLLVNDLGLDRIIVYRVNAATAELTPHEPEYWAAPLGSGPRHIAFHPSQKYVYCVNELASNVTTLAWNAKEGTLTSLATVEILPKDFPKNKAKAAEIAVTHKGDFVYVNNRGSDTIATLKVDPQKGTLSLVELTANGGNNTRHITLSPSEKFLIAANQDSAGIAVIPRNLHTSRLSAPQKVYTLDIPMFTLFI